MIKSDILQETIDKTIVIHTRQDVEAILDDNKRLRSERQKSDFMGHRARIPCVIEMKWLNEEWQRGNTKLRWGSREWLQIVDRKLQDPDWKYLLVGYGK